MRINKFIAERSNLSRRSADEAITQNRVMVNGKLATSGQQIAENDSITLDGINLVAPKLVTIIFNKPVGYICSRDGQGGKTIYDILPKEYHNLNPVGRLDKNSSGLLLLTNDGVLHQQLTHPKYKKNKVYKVTLNKKLTTDDLKLIVTKGVQLADGPSRFTVKEHVSFYEITMQEGRNRQIRRTFEALGYKVTKLHRIQFGPYKLNNLPESATAKTY